MTAHPLDFEYQANLYSTPELGLLFDEKARFQRWLDIEAALAASQAELGIIDQNAASRIAKAAHIDALDLQQLKVEYSKSKNSLIPLLRVFRKACGEAGEFIHYGATTQDIIDTGQILELKQAINIIYRDLKFLENQLIELAGNHKLTPMIGRTHSQQALPITLGFKAAIWLAENRRHIERIKNLAPRIFIGQLSGAVGTMAALGPQALQIAQKTMERLQLDFTPCPWHTARDNIAEASSICTLISGTLAKVANEIFQLGRTEIGELREGAPQKGQMSSSTMPHKSNPVLCERVAVLANHVNALHGAVLSGMSHENERDPRALWTEWLSMPQILIYTGTALSYMIEIFQNLQISEEALHKNLSYQKEAILSEWLMFKLAKAFGKMSAQEKVHTLLQEAARTRCSLKELLQEDPETAAILSADDLAMLETPGAYIGEAAQIVDLTIAATKKQQINDPKTL